MKIRSSTASCGICMRLSLVQNSSQDMAEPNAHQTKEQGADYVGAGFEPLSVAGETEGFEAEGGKRGVSAADPGHNEHPKRRRREPPSLRAGQRCEQSDEPAADYVHGQSAPGECFPGQPGHETITPIACRSAERAPQADP